jgi:hypothetical protein
MARTVCHITVTTNQGGQLPAVEGQYCRPRRTLSLRECGCGRRHDVRPAERLQRQRQRASGLHLVLSCLVLSYSKLSCPGQYRWGARRPNLTFFDLFTSTKPVAVSVCVCVMCVCVSVCVCASGQCDERAGGFGLWGFRSIAAAV